MATLAEQRAAIAAGMQASRTSNAAAERQAIHDNMVARRTGRGVQRDLNSLESSKRKSGELRSVEPRGARPATRSAGETRAEPARSNATGIAGPLVEKVGAGAADTRTYYPERTLPTTDGLMVLRVRRTKTITMVDANGYEVILEFSNVPGT